MRDNLEGIVYMVVIILLLMALFFGVHTVSTWHDEELWNDGYCDVCGGIWKYEQAVGHRASTSYIYVCEKCGKRIELNRDYSIYKSTQQGRK